VLIREAKWLLQPAMANDDIARLILRNKWSTCCDMRPFREGVAIEGRNRLGSEPLQMRRGYRANRHCASQVDSPGLGAMRSIRGIERSQATMIAPLKLERTSSLFRAHRIDCRGRSIQ
jgi:hypothetical protein